MPSGTRESRITASGESPHNESGIQAVGIRRAYLVMHGAEHARFSAAVEPHLDRRRVAGLFEDVKQIALAETDAWPIGDAADVYALLRRLAQRFAFQLLFGEGEPARIWRFGEMLADYHHANWVRAAMLARFHLPFTPYRQVLRQAEALMAFILEGMAARRGCPVDRDVRAALAAVPSGGAEPGGDAGGCPRDAARATAAHVAGFALASFETTSTTLTWALALLASHPAIAAALADEVAELGPLAAVDDPEVLAGLPLLNAVLNETMRLITPVPVLGFKTLRDGEITGFDLRENTTVMISPHLTHRDAGLYPAPDRFRPDRWTTVRPNTYEYLPFSGGPRRCPGFQFAKTNLRVALCAIMARYRLALPAGGRIDRAYAVITVPRNRVMLRLLPAGGRNEPPPAQGGSFFALFSRDQDAASRTPVAIRRMAGS